VVFYVLFPEKNDWNGKGEMPEKMAKTATKVKDEKKPVINKQVRTGMGMALLYSNGAPTPQMVEMGKTFAILSGMEELLLSLEPADFPVSFTEYVYTSADAFATATFVSSSSPSSRYVVVVNNNLKESREGQIFFLPHTKQVKDMVTGKVLPLREEASDNMLSASLKLEPGAGTVLQVDFAENEPGLILFEEDFSIATMAVKTKNIVRQPVPRGFGTGWNWTAQKETGASPDAKGVLIMENISKPVGKLGASSKTCLDVYMKIEGNFNKPESMIVEWIDNDGKRGWLRSNNHHLPTRIPEGIKDVEIQLADGASVSKILLWAIPKQKAVTTGKEQK